MVDAMAGEIGRLVHGMDPVFVVWIRESP